MVVEILPDSEAVALRAADIVAEQIRCRRRGVVGFATGGTPLGCYERLVELHETQGLDFSGLATFNLDEYVGLSPDHPQSYRTYMWSNLFSKVNVKRQRVHLPSGEACAAYECLIEESGGIDLQILGIGSNGHVAFNEPGASHATRTRVTTLAEETVRANARFFPPGEYPPRRAVTMGIGTILEARNLLLLATGKGKARAVAAAVEGPVTEDVPASCLQRHARVHVLLDTEAALFLGRTHP